MAKTLRSFKATKVKPPGYTSKKSKELVVMEEEDITPTLISDSPSLGPPTLKLLDQLEKVGYTDLAAKLRELQITDGLDKLDPAMQRLVKIEKYIDKLLEEENLDSTELKRLVGIITDIYQARAKALLLPYGTVSPRTALQGNKGTGGSVNVAIGIGTGVSPRPKN